MEGLKTFKIFISSPSDVAKERWIAKQVIEALFRKYKDKLKIETVFYEDRVQLANRGDFQSQIEKPSQSDLTIVILWSRLGSPLSSEYRGEISGKVPVTGTEWEFEDALKGALENNSPDLLVYKKTAPI
ncbi:MAG: DUF4062 domain-containing protein, partial [Epsilonproteobacteria bacterium]|nr:DUF4062 domain-containing protein [Campylobacterota bacterium]